MTVRVGAALLALPLLAVSVYAGWLLASTF